MSENTEMVTDLSQPDLSRHFDINLSHSLYNNEYVFQHNI